MKKLIVFLLLTFAFSDISRSQIAFTVKPGLNLNGANIGYKKNNFEPFVGLQFLNVKYKYKNNDQYNTEESETRIHVYMPYAGCKIFLFNNESIRGSISATIFKPLIFGKHTINGDEDDSYKENLKRFKIWGMEIGFGSEYLFNDYFSLGGEFGFRYGFYKKTDDADPDYSYTEDLNLNMTYVSASLNFYFPPKKKE